MAYQNIHGRVGGRGIRPWLLVPKLLAVCVYLGALVATSVVWFAYQSRWAILSPPWEFHALVEHLSFMFRFVIVPALLVVLVLGVMLFLQHPGVFIRFRWWRLKLLLLAVGLPAAHFFMSSRLIALRRVAVDRIDDPAIQTQLSLGLLVLMAGSVLIVILGRLKPRLGQNLAKSFGSSHESGHGGTEACSGAQTDTECHEEQG